jgi:AraC-like DNA-binding protein
MVQNTQAFMNQVCIRWWRSGYDQMICNMHLATWLAHLFEYSSLGSSDDLASRAEHYARRSLATGCSVADMAAAVDMAVTTFAEEFHKLRQQTPGAFLNELRMTEASRLLRTTAHSIAEIARRVGYKNRASFARAFGQTHGKSPTQYRQHCRGR